MKLWCIVALDREDNILFLHRECLTCEEAAQSALASGYSVVTGWRADRLMGGPDMASTKVRRPTEENTR